MLSDDYRRERDTNIKWGAGLQYDFTQRFSLRAEVERYAINDVLGNNGAINLVSLGAVYRFGSSRPARSAEEPVTRREQMREEYCTTLDIKFAIDSADIQREGIEQLVTVGNFLKKYNDASAMIEGHTDDVGSDEYNMDLSQRRAENAMNYLVQEQGVPGQRISAKGFGETRPVASNETEQGKRENRRVTASVTCVEDVAGMAPPKARVTMGSSITFDNNSTTVADRYHNELNKVASFLKDNPRVTAVVEGHAADLQNSTRAEEVSRQRAESVVNYLVNQQGVERSRLRADALGRDHRTAYNNTADGKQENRRVNIIFSYPQDETSPR
jgi:OOP family OmpA-OmpF porin